MHLSITPTPVLTEIHGQLARLWKGTTPLGRSVDVYVAAVATADVAAMDELDAALQETAPPPEAIVPAWMLTPARPGGSQ